MSCKPCVLVVDDDDDLRDSLVETLQDEGYEVDAARNGKEALDRLRDGSPHPCLILLDVMMPVMDGGTFRINQLADPALAEIPVLVISAHANASEKAREMRPAGFLRKPIALTELLAATAQHCGLPNATTAS